MSVASDVYHKDTTKLSNSMLATFCESRRLYEAKYVTKTFDSEPATKPMDRGDVIHRVLLEGRPLRSCVSIYNDRCDIYASIKGVTKDSREKMSANDIAEACQKAVISVDEFNSCKTLKALKELILPKLPEQHLGSDGSVTPTGRKHELEMKKQGYVCCVKRHEYDEIKQAVHTVISSEVWAWIENAKAECAIEWTNDLGMMCKCKPDFHVPLKDKVLAFDLKVTEYHTPKRWRSQIENCPRNLLQNVHYTRGLESHYGLPVEWRWVCLNPKAPYTPASICVNKLDNESTFRCHEFYDQKIGELFNCQQSGDFSDDHETEQAEIALRKFAFERVS